MGRLTGISTGKGSKIRTIKHSVITLEYPNNETMGHSQNQHTSWHTNFEMTTSTHLSAVINQRENDERVQSSIAPGTEDPQQ